MDESIHETIAKQMEWVALDDLERITVAHRINVCRTAKAEVLMLMSEYYNQEPNSPYAIVLKRIAQGIIKKCVLLNIFSKKEQKNLLSIINSKN